MCIALVVDKKINPACVIAVQSQSAIGTSKMRASVCVINVLPTPDGPSRRIFDFSSLTGASVSGSVRNTCKTRIKPYRHCKSFAYRCSSARCHMDANIISERTDTEMLFKKKKAINLSQLLRCRRFYCQTFFSEQNLPVRLVFVVVAAVVARVVTP